MFDPPSIKVIIPAYNEADSIGKVIDAIPDWVNEIVVVDNNSNDQTGKIAAQHGARVIREVRQGYGQACLTGIAALGYCDIVVFLDGDFSDYPEEMDRLVRPILQNNADLVIGSRTAEQGLSEVLTFPQRFGNSLACFLMGLIWRECFKDLGPFRAIRFSSLQRLNMSDRNYGWTIEMQIKALRAKLRLREVSVSYRRRIGESKISGTVRGAIGAGTKIIWTILRQAIAPTPVSLCRPERVILFSRFPLPGRAKTRLIPAVGGLQAARLQRQLTEKTLEAIRPLFKQRPLDFEVHYTGGSWRQMRRWLGEGCHYRMQAQGDLGQRLHAAFCRAFDSGCEKVIIVGTDCPSLDDRHVENALKALNDHELVLGPSSDGGYWLIGLTKPADIFKGIAWGGPEVLQATLQQAQRHKLSFKLLEELDDIDEPEDLVKLPKSFLIKPVYLSVVIPTLNEAEHIRAAIQSVQADGVEVIVADGGSTDATIEQAQKLGVQVVQGQPGRARQMNQGARVAQGEVFLFLHADTFLPASHSTEAQSGDIPEAVSQIFSALADGHTVGGAFAFATDYATTGMGLIEKSVDWRNRLFHLPFGDQGLFVRREVFEAINGFAEVEIGEDFFFIQKMKRYGRIEICPAQAVTSGRRWRQHGLILNSFINLCLLAGLGLNLPHRYLSKIRGKLY